MRFFTRDRQLLRYHAAILRIVSFCAIFLILWSSPTLAQSLSRRITFLPELGSLKNPLKGWAPYSDAGDRHFDPTTMSFFYVSWRDLEPTRGVYRFDLLESRWENRAARGKHVVLRLYLDYPNEPTGIPQWLLDSGIELRPYRTREVGNGVSPDYDDPRLTGPLLELIHTMGQRYDSNPRVAFIEIGALGFWGEWHTWPREELFASAETQEAVVDAYREAFPNKMLLARYPAGVTGTQDWIGYHDDYFPLDTAADSNFLGALRSSGRTNNYRVAAIGAEMVPDRAESLLTRNWGLTKSMLRRAHISWIGPYNPALERLSKTARENSRTLVRLMGYDFRFAGLNLQQNNRELTVVVRGGNIGTAPFYYAWEPQFALIDRNGTVRETTSIPVDIRSWQPGRFEFDHSFTTSVAPGTYSLAFGIIDPWKQRPGIRLANKVTQRGGWNVLTSIRVTE